MISSAVVNLYEVICGENDFTCYGSLDQSIESGFALSCMQDGMVSSI